MIKKTLLIALLPCFIFADFNLCQEDNFSSQSITLLKEAELCNEQNITKTINTLLPLTKQNNPHAEFILGEIYLYGIGGISRNFNKAYTMHEKAYIHGYKGSAVALGKMNVLGQGRKQDCKKGIELYELAQEIPVSSYLLGVVYFSPICGDINLTKAEQYFKYASEHSIPEAQYYYALLLDKKDSEKNKDEVLNLITSSAENGYVKAQVLLGHGYILGENIEQDYKKAKFWIQKAQAQNDSVAIEIWNKYKLWNY